MVEQDMSNALDERLLLDALAMAVKAEAKAEDSRVRRAAQRAGFQVHKVSGRFTLARSRGIEVQGLTAQDAMRWLREFGF
jgi:hypothetical protein